MVPIMAFSVLLIISVAGIIGCSSGDRVDSSQVITGCSPVPRATAPDIAICAGYSHDELEAAVNTAGGGCSERAAETITDGTDGIYTVECSNQCGTVTARGKITYIKWIDDWNKALSIAQTENKPIMINFYTDVCPACRALDRNTFADRDVAAFLCTNFVTVKSNAGKAGLHASYGISGVPTTVITRPDGTEIGRIIGYYDPDQFLEGAKQAIAEWNHLQD